MGDRIVPYDENYIEQCFVFWYNNGRPPGATAIKFDDFPLDQYGRKPVRRIVEAWINEKGWRERADVLDAKASTQIDDDLVALKVDKLKKQAAQAGEIREAAFDYILQNGFDSSASAISAFVKASEIERITIGISKTIQKLAEMDDSEVLKTVMELAERAGSTIIDGEETLEEETIEEDAEPLE